MLENDNCDQYIKNISSSCTLTTVGLIRLVLAVYISVTFPVEVNTFSTPAPELPGWAVGFLRLGLAAAALQRFIRLVFAVGVSVAAPRRWDTLGVVTAKLVRPAGAGGGCRALLLIAAISAVIIPIADERGSHAQTVTALELFSRASLGIWKKEECTSVTQNLTVPQIHI